MLHTVAMVYRIYLTRVSIKVFGDVESFCRDRLQYNCSDSSFLLCVSTGFIENIVESISFRVFIKVLNDVEYFVHIGSDRRVLIVASIPCMLLKLAWRLMEFSISVVYTKPWLLFLPLRW